MIRSRKWLPVFGVLLSCGSLAAQDARSELGMRAAVSPLPQDLRAGAGVLIEASEGTLERLKDSGNGISCVWFQPSDDDDAASFDARCYNDAFWPAILRRWELGRSSATYAEGTARMHEEIRAGQVTLPDVPTAGYRIMGPLDDFDFEAGTPGPSTRKWQSIHFPFQTAEALGLTEAEEESQSDLPGLMPFVMASGTWWAHVMIVHQPFLP